MNRRLRDKLTIEITRMLLEKGLESPTTPPFCYFLRANPLLLANAIVEGKKMTHDELMEVYPFPSYDP